MKKIVGVDLFCGVGGLTYGLKQAGIDIRAGIDNDSTCKYAFEKNNKAKFICENIKNIRGKDLLKHFPSDSYKLIAGCAPCQPYSTHQNKNTDKSKHSKYGLILEMLRIIKEIKPEFVTMENVPQIRFDPLLKNFKKWFEVNKYQTLERVVNVSKYGIPQNRKRYVFVASKFSKINFPEETKNTVTVKEAIGWLPKIKAGETCVNDLLHTASNLSRTNIERIKASKPGGTWRDWPTQLLPACYKRATGKTFSVVYGRIDPNKPAPTLTTQFNRYGTGRYGHYEQDRALSLREGALIQSFPRHYDFGIAEGISRTDIAKHVGNAVPPALGTIIGKILNVKKRNKNGKFENYRKQKICY